MEGTAPPSRFFNAASQSIFFVGNSLTEDTISEALTGGGTYLPRFSADTSGADILQTEFHIEHGQDLTFIVANPSAFYAVYPSQWNTALPAKKYKYYSFQPFTNDTVGSELAAYQTLVSSAQSSGETNAKFFVYEGWPDEAQTGVGNYSTYWNGGGTSNASTAFVDQLANFTYVYGQLQGSLGAAVYVIPIGDVMAALDQASINGQILGASTLHGWYRDGTHMGGAGRFAATCTVVSTILQKPCTAGPQTLSNYEGLANGTATVTLTTALATQISGIVWNVVSADPRAIH